MSQRIAALFATTLSFAQSRPSFEVASVKLAPSVCTFYESPGRISQCGTMALYIQVAYNLSAFGPHHRQGRRLKIQGAPEWVMSDQYEITAKASSAARSDEMHGPMLQALLEDRFKLKIHREAIDAPVYVLTVAKSGLKLKALKPGSCTPPYFDLPQASDCGTWTASRTANLIVDSRGETMAEFADDLSNLGSDRVIIDKTGTSGLFNFHLEFAMGDAESAGPSLFTAVGDQLGLKLTAARGPVDVFVIDHVERPTAN